MSKFTQVCVWPGTVCGLDRIDEFVKFMADEFNGTRVQYLREILTNPDTNSKGLIVKGTGGRNDLFFAVHSKDLGKFAVPRLIYGIRWIEDVYGNGQGHLYPEDVKSYCSWKDFNPDCESADSSELESVGASMSMDDDE